MPFFSRYIAAILTVVLFLSMPMSAGAESENEENGDDYIKWVDFNVSYKALCEAMNCDIETYEGDVHLNWIELLSYLGAKYGGDFSKYRQKDLSDLTEKLKSGASIDELTADMKYYTYYHEAYSAVLGGFIGEYSVQVPGENEELAWETRYGLKAFFPIAAGFGYNHYDDFGAKRSYGFTRRHLGHDMFGAIGTPIIAIESGFVEVMGWNQYGGWRLGIRSFDGLRYYYFAHLRQNRPYHADLKEGDVVKAGDVIGYMGHTGYSTKENVNNIKQTHLHYGLQLIFHPSQKECNNEIWIDVYAITKLLERNRSETYRVAETKEFYRLCDFDEPVLHQGQRQQES